MPYIEEERRDAIVTGNDSPNTAGELNFLFTVIALCYLSEKGTSYDTINDVLGALDGASKEFYRRVAVPHEEKKIRENGDLYDLSEGSAGSN